MHPHPFNPARYTAAPEVDALLNTRQRLILFGVRSGVVLAVIAPVQSRAAAPAVAAAPAHFSIAGLPTRPLVPGARFTLTLNARLDPGWHIYALEEPDGGPIATEIGLAAGDPLTLLRVDETRPRMARDSFYTQPTGLFQDTAAFTLHLALPPHTLAKPIVLHVQVRYQACSDKVCLPPRTQTVAVPLASMLR